MQNDSGRAVETVEVMQNGQRKKILHIIGGGEFGGAEQYLINVAIQMKRTEYEMHLACFYDRRFAQTLRTHGIPIHVILPTSRFDVSLANRIADLIREQSFDIIHTHGVRANFFGRLAARKQNRIRKKHGQPPLPVYTTIHSELRQDYPHPLAYSLASMLEHLTQHLTDTYVAISNSIKDDMVRRSIPSEKIHVIYSGIDFEQFSESTSDVAEPEADEFNAIDQNGTPLDSEHNRVASKTINLRERFPGQAIIGIVGRLQAVKGHQYAIQAMPKILAAHPDTQLVLVGGGPLQGELQSLTEQLKLQSHVCFLGFQQPIAEIVKQFDIFLMPSLSEGLGLSLIEAMSQGVPAIATQVGGMVDVIRADTNGEGSCEQTPAELQMHTAQTQQPTGVFVPPTDPAAIATAVIALLDDSANAIAMGLRGQADVQERFNSQRMIEQMVQMYNRQQYDQGDD